MQNTKWHSNSGEIIGKKVAMMWDFASYGKYHVVGFETLK
jgi:hypothetical protein